MFLSLCLKLLSQKPKRYGIEHKKNFSGEGEAYTFTIYYKILSSLRISPSDLLFCFHLFENRIALLKLLSPMERRVHDYGL